MQAVPLVQTMAPLPAETMQTAGVPLVQIMVPLPAETMQTVVVPRAITVRAPVTTAKIPSNPSPWIPRSSLKVSPMTGRMFLLLVSMIELIIAQMLTPCSGQVASLTSTNNFINFCLTVPNLPITNGQQIKTGSCNPAPMGVLPSTDNMPSSKFVSPKNGDVVKANTAFTITMAIQGMQTGFFVNANENYFAAPQFLNAQGQIQGHSHVVVEQLNAIDQTTPTDPRKFAFFKGLNAAAQNGQLTASVDKGLPAGVYKLSSINSAANHQPVLVPIAQHGSLDDAVYFTVTADGQPDANSGVLNGNNNGTAAGNTGANNNGTTTANTGAGNTGTGNTGTGNTGTGNTGAGNTGTGGKGNTGAGQGATGGKGNNQNQNQNTNTNTGKGNNQNQNNQNNQNNNPGRGGFGGFGGRNRRFARSRLSA
ncbi:hypothetical protein AN958_08486 [Leucoagaricus sp. SymC.cos]|nr:hypothetical protein AN958_08486 [Leucoagaricus sp. SymC.cos]